MRLRRLSLAVATATLVGMAVQSASAINYSLSLGNPDISAFTGPFGGVNVTLNNSTHATITFTAASVGAYNYLFGDGGTVGVNVNASSWTLGSVTASNPNAFVSPSGPTNPNGGSGNEDGFGVFNQRIDSFDGFTHASASVSFTLTDLSGTWASDADVLTANSFGNFVAAHTFIANADGSNTGVTGYAAGNTPGGSTPGVPDGGSTVAFLGCGLAGIGVVSRKFRKS